MEFALSSPPLSSSPSSSTSSVVYFSPLSSASSSSYASASFYGGADFSCGVFAVTLNCGYLKHAFSDSASISMIVGEYA